MLAVAFSGWSGWSYWQAGHGGDLSVKQLRDQVLRSGQQEIADLNSVSGKQAGAGLRRWLDVTAGPLHTQLRRTEASYLRQISRAGSSARGTVTGAAVTQLNQQAGTAQIIASVQVQITPEVGATSTDINRYQAGMTRTAAGWKVSTLIAIPASGR
jgi:Mce-associated membrane protein